MKKLLEVPEAYNEKALTYAPGTTERAEIRKVLKDLKSKVSDIPMVINGKEVRTNNRKEIRPPHELSHLLGYYHSGDGSHVNQAIEAALNARQSWMSMHWRERASIFLRVASLVSGPYRSIINATTMLGQSKTVHQAEIDAACEFADFMRYNVNFMNEIYQMQPESHPNTWNRLDYRPLEGFVYALSPFNFTAIAANLPAAPALMGNVVVWRPSATQIYSATIIMKIFMEAGLPDGVINMIFTPGADSARIILGNKNLAGIHFTGSTNVFYSLWQKVGENIASYKNYPRLIGETGGKDFILAHSSANIRQVATAMTRGAFEYQGQKCSAASRAFISKKIWPEVKEEFLKQVKKIRIGNPEDFTNFMGAVIDEKSFDNIKGYIDKAKNDPDVEILTGGTYDKSKGYFIEPTLLICKNPDFITMREEIFGPVLSVHIFEDEKFNDVLTLIDESTVYALTGAIFASDRSVINSVTKSLTYAAGNFYINDKPTGAVVGHQPFGGARASGTNDKSGSIYNLLRWITPRTIKECFLPPEDYQYPFMRPGE